MAHAETAHPARLYNGRIWVDNSGYGQVGYVDGAEFQPIAGLPGWTRGPGFTEGAALLCTSRILPRFSKYAPGLDADASARAYIRPGFRVRRILGGSRRSGRMGVRYSRLRQCPEISALACLSGFRRGDRDREKHMFYSFQVPGIQEE